MVEPFRQIVRLDVDDAEAELAADALWQADPSAVSITELEGGRVRLVADLDDPGAVQGWEVEVLHLDSDDYLDQWRVFAQPARAGRHLVVQPPWLPAGIRRPDDLVVLIDPGRTFGSGSHPATRLALAALEAHLRPGEVMADVGCGSGVLAVAAVLLGAGRAIAVDVDPAAVVATRDNAGRNAVVEAVTVREGSVEAVGETVDVVVANIGLAVLREIGPDLAALLRPGGRLVLSGLLEGQADEVVGRLAGCEEIERPAEGGWVAPVVRRLS